MELLKKHKNKVLIVIALLTSFSLGRFMQPERVVIKKEEIVKEAEHTKKEKRQITKEVTHPDGTKETVVINEEINSSDKQKEKQSTSEKVVENSKKQWKVAATAVKKKDPQHNSIVYGVNVEKRLFGPLFIGTSFNQDRDFGVSIGLEF